MEAPLHAATRLLTALEDLVREETSLLDTMEFVEAAAIRERAAPVVDRICLLAGEPGVQSLRPRVDAVLESSRRNFDLLTTQLGILQPELDRVGEARGKLRRVAPAYKIAKSGSPLASSRLNTAA